MEFGKILREAREAKGYSVGQLAERTRIITQVIEDLEHEDFKRIAAPIYGRGFVKLCCIELGLDPKPMIDEFMMLYTGEKPAADKVSPPMPAPAPVIKTPEPMSCPHPTAAAAPLAPQSQRELFEDKPEPPPADEKTVSRYAPLVPHEDDRRFANPFAGATIPWRLIVLVLGAVAVIVTLVIGCRALYRLLNEPQETPTAETAAETAKPAAAAKPPRTPKPVKSLYID